MRGTNGCGALVDLPLPRASEAVSSLAERPHRLDGSGPVVLLVSSDAATRALTGELLRDEGYRAVEAAHGREAEAILAAGGVDLMITDIVMPEQDGFGNDPIGAGNKSGSKDNCDSTARGELPIAYRQDVRRRFGDFQACGALDSKRCHSRTDRRSR